MEVCDKNPFPGMIASTQGNIIDSFSLPGFLLQKGQYSAVCIISLGKLLNEFFGVVTSQVFGQPGQAILQIF